VLQIPMGYYYAVEVMGAEAIMTTIPEPMGRCAFGMCRTFHFHVTGPLLCQPVLTDGQVLGPLVSAWVK
jgi:hypothetical protein